MEGGRVTFMGNDINYLLTVLCDRLITHLPQKAIKQYTSFN